MEAVVKEYHKNRYGINIVKCCASCQHRGEPKDYYYRLCCLDKRKHRTDYLCSSWSMDMNLSNAGKGGGMVKNPMYIRYSLEHGAGHAEEYEQQYGSRYLTKK